MIRHHPTVGQVNIIMELDCDHFRVYLDDHAFQPTANALFILVIMVAKHLHNIAYPVVSIFFRRR
jgi:hypothetical protein